MSQLDLIYRILAIIFPVLAIVLVGYLYARYRRDTEMSSGNRINIEIFLPAPCFTCLGGILSLTRCCR